MKKTRIALCVASAMLLGASSSMAAIPSTVTDLSAAAQTSAPELTQTASFALGCHDPNYSWWEYSGIEALTCLYSGQWG
ncbi:hypothetical protein [Rhizobium halophytocola]|uniref:Uncharacterized protein n=1 Tax=Rhizobium halophytocola TaxID=735519 RepID=A0ABS4E3L6_9HYPH|nr:hypothetical protein [Rhizobium halophytocola]MBP1852539.1 hypothetical protein [Rhizobium halophytocola]